MEKMFINARNSEEIRIAIVRNEDKCVMDVVYEHPGQELTKGNIYNGIVTHREKSLNAIFVKYTTQEGIRDGFLAKGEILLDYFHNPNHKSLDQLSVEDIPEGSQIIVQVDKEGRGTKGAALTTYISLAGRYLVLMPKNPRAGGISRRIEGEDRSELRENLSQLNIPEHAGVIIRTAGVGKNLEDLQWDLDVLIKVWDAIESLAKTKTAPFLIHLESDVIGRVVRDYLRQDISEIWVDTKEAWEKVSLHVTQLNPNFLENVKYYEDKIPLFSRYHIESQLEATFQRQLRLPSGGNIVIDHTEALVSIDVNSAKSTRARDIEETAFYTNLEAAKEVARQMRLRDINGIIVIDFIDMSDPNNQREVENTLREEVKFDRARIQIGRISKFGTLEMSRQRLRPSLKESSTVLCPRCHGQGRIRGIESLALAILRLLREEAITKKVAQIEAQLPVSVATYLLNEKRYDLYEIETFYNTKVLLISNEFIETPDYHILSRSKEELSSRPPQASYRLVESPLKSFENEPHSIAVAQIEPALKTVSLNLPLAPGMKQNWWNRLWNFILKNKKNNSEQPLSSSSSPEIQQYIPQKMSKESQYARKYSSSSVGRSNSYRGSDEKNERFEHTKRYKTRDAGQRQNYQRDHYEKRKPIKQSLSTSIPIEKAHEDYKLPDPVVETFVPSTTIEAVNENVNLDIHPIQEVETMLTSVELPVFSQESVQTPDEASETLNDMNEVVHDVAQENFEDKPSKSRRYPRSHHYHRRRHHNKSEKPALDSTLMASIEDSQFPQTRIPAETVLMEPEIHKE